MNGRKITLYLSAHVEHLDGECSECGFDALERITTHVLTPSGVSFRDQLYCGRCRAEEARG